MIWQKLNLHRGTILSGTIDVDICLGLRLRRYFFPKSNRRASILGWDLIEPLSFDQKIALYEKIPDFKKAKSYRKVKDSLRRVQRLRNAMAHWHLSEKDSTESDIRIYRFSPWRTMVLNDKLMEEFIENEKFLLTALGWGTVARQKYAG